MSFDNLKTEITDQEPVWRQVRPLFPVTENSVYLNHAAVAPLSIPAAMAMKSLADEVMLHGALNYDAWMRTYHSLRSAAARLIGATPDEIALVKNTSEGIATVALGIDWRAGDSIAVFEEEFPANFQPWLRLEARGVRLKRLSIRDPLDRIDEACRGARLLAISYVNYLNGIRIDLGAMGEICRRRGCFYFVDAIQGMGAFPIDVQSSGIDALAADGHKWMLGPEGCGVLYVRKERQDEIEPVEFGWTNVDHYNTYAVDNLTLRPNAGRYECGTLNTIGCYGLRAALELILETGVERIGRQIGILADRIAVGAEAKGYEIAARRTPQNSSGIVSFRKPGVDCRMVVTRLAAAGIQAAPRLGWVRTSPHHYQNEGEMDRMIEALP